MNHTKQSPMKAAAVSRLRVTKKLAPTDRGSIKLSEEFGDTLVCVRHRLDAQAKIRYTTVELCVARVEVKPRPPVTVAIRTNPDEYALRRVLRAAGATFDSRLGLWKLHKRVATILRLTSRVVESK
jgi:hypothetical protein